MMIYVRDRTVRGPLQMVWPIPYEGLWQDLEDYHEMKADIHARNWGMGQPMQCGGGVGGAGAAGGAEAAGGAGGYVPGTNGGPMHIWPRQEPHRIVTNQTTREAYEELLRQDRDQDMGRQREIVAEQQRRYRAYVENLHPRRRR